MTPANDNNALRFLSVCSGIEAASVAWNPLGWKAVAFSEIEKFPSAVLAHHYPDVPNLGDFTKIDTTKLGRVDILSGGTPCQAFSVAGLRNSLADARGNLTLSFVRLAHELAGIAETPLGSEPGVAAGAAGSGERQSGNGLRNVVWENVPGVLSTKDNAFGCFLGALVGADGALPPPSGKRWPDAGMVDGPKCREAWRVLDAQYFGLAQRRRRVILVADFGNGADPAAVLFELEGLLGNPAPSREARKDVAPKISARTNGGGGLGTDFDLDGGLVEETFAIQERAVSENLENGPQGKGYQPSIAYTLEARNKVQAVAYAPEIARCVATREGSSQDYETTTMVAQPRWAPDISAALETTSHDYSRADGFTAIVQPIAYSIMPQNSGKDYKARVVDVAQPLMAGGPVGGNQGGDFIVEPLCVTGEITHALKAEGADASEDGTGRGNPIVNAYRTAGDGAVYDEGRDDVAPLTTNTDPNANIVTFDIAHPPVSTLRSAVRRLTPVECERLQGFKDNYTRIPWRNKPAEDCPDGPRYKALGNSWAVPKFVWLGKRIAALMPRSAA